MMFTPGDKLEFGHYTILRELGSGGMGVVYHCRDEFLQRELAIKMLLPELMADDDTVEIFRQEARLAAQLEHPGIVTIYNIGMENREGKIHHYMAMEYLPGGSLRQRIARGQISLEQAVEWMKELTTALHYAHKRGVVHQDIKPDNIFITQDGNAKIGDFGLALIATGVAFERAAGGKGTPAYMSPELCRGEPRDHRSDIYSLGAVFFEMLTGQMPFKATGMIEMALKHATAPVPSAADMRKDLPPILNKAVKYMMAKSPDSRLQSLGDLLPSLDKLLLEMKVARMGVGLRADGRAKPAADGEQKTATSSNASNEQKLAEPVPQPVATAAGSAESRAGGVGKPQVVSAQAAPAAVSPDYEPPPAHLTTTADIVPVPVPSPGPAATPNSASQAQSAVPQPAANVGVALPPLDFRPEDPAVSEPVTVATPTGTPAEPVGVSALKPSAAPSKRELEPDKERQPDVLWRFKTRGPIGWASAPVLNRSKKAIYVGSSDGALYCLDMHSGRMLWLHDTGAPVVASPLVSGDRLYVPVSDGELKCLSVSDGSVAWSFAAGAPIFATPILSDGMIVIATLDGSVKAVACEEGAATWTYRCDGELCASPQAIDSTVFIAGKDKHVHAISADKGRRKWQAETAGDVIAECLASTDSVYCATTSGKISCFDIVNGNKTWTYESAAAFTSRGTLEFTSINFISSQGTLFCLDKYKGTPVWEANMGAEVLAGLVSVTGSLYVASTDGYIQCFNSRTGDLKWFCNLGTELEGSPLPTSQAIYIGTVGGEVLALTPPK